MTLNTTTHKNILIKILKDIYTDSTIGPILGFKGGTAVYLFYNLYPIGIIAPTSLPGGILRISEISLSAIRGPVI